MSTSEIDHLLSTTRAVRKRLDLERPVEPGVILECLRLAIQAPSGGNRQNWRFVVVTDPEKRAGLGELYRSGGRDYLATRRASITTDDQLRAAESSEYLASVIERVPVHVIPCLIGRPPAVENQAGFFGSIHPAAWSFMLALRSRGLGSTWTTFHLAHEREAAALIGIPDDVTQVALLPVAHTIGTEFKPARRRPVEEVTYWNEFGNTEH
ncbi:nitroreductase family protein [Jiangella asiatica]|uniref:nitroreductase family protein n=1 Tax=Jiangella asiatica TaxID=2530372 RepID=UPI0013A5C474|nr:nitroreductase family protein [Jiangella asiatica]